MKKYFLLPIILLTFISCSKSERGQIRGSSKPDSVIVKEEDKKSDRLVYDVEGTIYHKEENRGDYFFFIKLTTGEVFEWEVDKAQYFHKDTGDTVHFEYLAKKRFSKEAKSCGC